MKRTHEWRGLAFSFSLFPSLSERARDIIPRSCIYQRNPRARFPVPAAPSFNHPCSIHRLHPCGIRHLSSSPGREVMVGAEEGGGGGGLFLALGMRNESTAADPRYLCECRARIEKNMNKLSNFRHSVTFFY